MVTTESMVTTTTETTKATEATATVVAQSNKQQSPTESVKECDDSNTKV